MLGCAPGVVAQALQRVIHARRSKQRQRQGLAAAWLKSAIGNAVVHGLQVRQVKHVTHPLAALQAQAAFDMLIVSKRKMHRNGLAAGTYFKLDGVVCQQQGELLQVIPGVKIRSRQRGFKAAGTGNETIAQVRCTATGQSRCRSGLHPHKRIAGAHMTGQILTRHIPLHGLAQVGHTAVVNQPGLCQCSCRIRKTHRGDEGGQIRHAGIVHACVTVWGKHRPARATTNAFCPLTGVLCPRR
ncbi:hypothetical protein GALL_520810 [mine drainage metagenome]|uniref:Uncharacterized protein n=1 Tax=mine drainage metagenome TaxID=410659 RepID=A0A1J5PEV7_9ZZZZ